MKKLFTSAFAAALMLAPSLGFAAQVPTSNEPFIDASSARAMSKADANFTQLFGSLTPVATPYQGNIFTGVGLATTINNALQSGMSRNPHFVRNGGQAATGGFIVLPCWYGTASSTQDEHPTGSNASYTATVEYNGAIVGTFTWGGNTTGTCVDGTNLTSDTITFSAPVPDASRAFTRIHEQNAAGLIFTTGGDILNGNGFTSSSTSTPDLTQAVGPISGGGNAILPLAFVTTTTARSFALDGTSRVFGTGDTFTGGPNTDRGTLARSIGPFAAYMNLGLPSDRTDYWLASHTNRAQLDAYASDDIDEVSINGINAGVTAAQEQANLTAMAAAQPVKNRKFLTTTEPYVTQGTPTLTGLVANGNGLQATIGSTTGLYVGEVVTLAGATPTTDNGPCQILSITSGSGFSCLNPNATGTATATGTITFSDALQSTTYQIVQGTNTALVALNAWKRIPALIQAAGFYKTLEVADVVGPRDAGVWGVTYAPSSVGGAAVTGARTADGLHPNPATYLLIQQSGAISPRTLN